MNKPTAKQIREALKAGIIDQARADSLLADLSTAPTSPKPDEDNVALIGNEDDMRFVRSFSDVFIATGIGLLILGLIGFTLIGGPIISLIGMALMWLLAEYFGRKKRAHLPTLISALGFLFFVHAATSNFIPDSGMKPGVAAAFVTLLTMLVFYWRFRLPFAIALIAISVLILIFSFFAGHIPLGLLLLLSGILFFIVALLYDIRDPARKTRYADNAFWLHLTAAPLILHGIMAYTLVIRKHKIMGGLAKVPAIDNTDAAIMLLIVAALAFVGLAINRRALLVSSLGYAVIAITMLIKRSGLDVGSATALAFLLLGLFIVFLGAGWHGARRLVLTVLPRRGVFAKLFPPAQ
ncbi:MAG TPA: hypothetical protein ENK01_01480 [Hellea balneolensis]|uniref:DUF2157 domain-containing protein n=1 Tax=Hellea balneolensis TaxID=287478 RepID=A0A7V5NWJ5_9PROT|nr:hypothetical protein [Hellea balneolensis]